MSLAVTDLSSLRIQNQLLTAEVKRRIDQLAAINTVAATVGQSLDLDVTLDTALTVVLEIVGAEAGGISLIDHDTREVVIRAQRGWTRDLEKRPMRIPVDQGMSGKVIQTNETVVDNNLDGNEDLAIPSFLEEEFRSIVMAPMHARGEIIGILSIMSSTPNQFNEEIIGVLRAIADTVGVALNNAQLYENALENEKNLGAILDSSTDGIIATDQKSRVRLINHKAEDMFEVNATQLKGMPLREIPIEPNVRDVLLRALNSRTEAHQESFEVTFESGLVASIAVLPIYFEQQIEQHGSTDGWVIVLRDVTHLREAELSRAQFIAAAAHDMRSPLSVTLNSVKLLDSMLEHPDPTIAELIGLAQNGVMRLQALIDDVLKLEQIAAGYGVDREPIEIASLLREAARQIKPLIKDKKIDFNLDVPEDLPIMNIDQALFNRAVINYLDNALKYTPEGGEISLKAFISDNLLHIEVSDNGPGIPPQEQPRLFERFYRAPGTRSLPGTGLGLAIVKSIAETNGGDVYVRSHIEQGSTFGMTLALNFANNGVNPVSNG